MIQAVKDYTDAVENWHPIIYNLYKNIWLACERNNQDAKSWLVNSLDVKSDILIKLVEGSMRSFSLEIEKGIKDSDNSSETARRIAERLNERIVWYYKIWDTDVEERRECEENYLFLWNESVLDTEGSHRNSRLIEILAENSGEEKSVNTINTLRNLIHRINGKVENVATVLEKYTDENENATDWEKMKKPKIMIPIKMNELYNFALDFIGEVGEDKFSKCIRHGFMNPLYKGGKENKIKRMVYHLRKHFAPEWLDVVCKNLQELEKYKGKEISEIKKDLSRANFGNGERGRKLRDDFDSKIPL